MTSTDNTWNSCKTWSKARNMMVDYIKGKLPRNPWMCGPMYDDTIPIRRKLIKINRSGFMTISGQPGTITKYKAKRMSNSQSGKKGDSMVESQRGYMEGFIHNNIFTSFMNSLLKTGKVVIYGEQFATNGFKGMSEDERKTMIRPYHKKGDIGIAGTISLTTETNMTTPDIEYGTNFWIHRLPGISDAMRAPPILRQLLLEKTTYVFIIMKKYGDTSLSDLVLKALVSDNSDYDDTSDSDNSSNWSYNDSSSSGSSSDDSTDSDSDDSSDESDSSDDD